MDQYTIRVFRYNPETNRKNAQDFKISALKGWTVLNALNEIKWNYDGSLSYRRSCRHGICGSCAMTINGVNHLACETQLDSFGTVNITVEPLRAFPVIKDLIVDMNPMYEKLYTVKPYFINNTPVPSDQERYQSIEDRKKIDGSYECIMCGSCTSSCPSFWSDRKYLGPNAFLKAHRFIVDSRDEGQEERLEILNDKHGLWRCHTIYNCVEACPKELNPTNAIGELKCKLVTDGN